jgi:CHAT domain-containing protein/Tfp pilus assembly protein PilF
MLLRGMGRPAEARPNLEEALAVRKKVLGPEHPDTAASLNNLGLLLSEMGQHAEARRHHEEALAVRKKVLGPEHPQTADSLNNLAVLLSEMDQHAEARRHHEEALAVWKKVLGAEHPHTARSLTNLGTVLHKMGQHVEARRHYEEALGVWKKVLGAEHPDTAGSLNNLGVLLQEMGEEPEAWQKLMLASATWAQFLARTAVLSAQRDHPDLVAPRRNRFSLLVSVAEQTRHLAADQRQDLLTSLLDWKAIGSAALSVRRGALLASTDPDTRERFAKLKAVRQQLADLSLRGPGRLPPGQYRTTCDDLRREEDRLERDLAGQVKDYARLRRAQRARPDDLAKELAPGQVLVELAQYDYYDFTAKDRARRRRPARYAAVLLWRPADAKAGPEIRFVPLGPAEPVNRAIRAWRAEAASGPVDPATERALRERVWEPVARALPAGARSLVIAPDGELALLPFEAVRLADDRYLVERFQVSYVSHGRDLMPTPLPQDKPGPALVLTDPDYEAVGDAPTPPVDARVARADAPRSGDFEKRGIRFKRLPGFAREADAVARAWQAARPGEPMHRLQGPDASEERLAASKRPRLLYLITHGFFLPDLQLVRAGRDLRNFEIVPLGPGRPRPSGSGEDPRLRSGLALAGANRWQQRAERGQSDGLLTALEVENLDLWGTELVVLSACETGLGQVEVGEGVLGLRRAFQNAGAQAVLASLWKVPDRDTERLMAGFFRRWLQGTPKAQALREAQLELLAELRKDADPKRRPAPPLLWAGFICHGRAD